MSGLRFAFWFLLGVTLAVYLAIVLWSLPAISRSAEGLAPFDLRPWGYDAAAARAFLSALTPEGRALYLGPQRWLDLVYPALLAGNFCAALWHLLRRRSLALRLVLLALPLAAAGFDYLENFRIWRLLTTAPGEVNDAMVAAASFATVAKSLLTTAAFLVLVAVLAARYWRGLGQRGKK